jgi:hypothetical protein
MEFSINCMLIASDMEYLNKYLKYSFKVDDYCEDNNHELEVSTVLEVSKERLHSQAHASEQEEKKEEEYQESEASEEEYQESEASEEEYQESEEEEEEYQESEEEEEDEESEDELEDFDSDDEENKNTLVQKIVYKIKGIKHIDNKEKCLNICCCNTTFSISNIEKRKKRCIICEEVLFEPLEHLR